MMLGRIGSVLHGMRAFCCQFAAVAGVAGELAAVGAVFGVLGCQFAAGGDLSWLLSEPR